MALLARKSLEEYKRGQRAGERVFIKVTYMTSALVSHAIQFTLEWFSRHANVFIQLKGARIHF